MSSTYPHPQQTASPNTGTTYTPKALTHLAIAAIYFAHTNVKLDIRSLKAFAYGHYGATAFAAAKSAEAWRSDWQDPAKQRGSTWCNPGGCIRYRYERSSFYLRVCAEEC